MAFHRTGMVLQVAEVVDVSKNSGQHKSARVRMTWVEAVDR